MVTTQFDPPLTPTTQLRAGMYLRAVLVFKWTNWLDPFAPHTLADAVAQFTAWYDDQGLGIARVGNPVTPTGGGQDVAVLDFHVLPNFVPLSPDGDASAQWFVVQLQNQGGFSVQEITEEGAAATGQAQGATSRADTASTAQATSNSSGWNAVWSNIKSVAGNIGIVAVVLGLAVIIGLVWWWTGHRGGPSHD